MMADNFLKIKALFFNNLGLKQTILKNTFWLAVGKGVSTLLKIFLVIYIAKILGPTEFGKFTFALAFIGLFVIFSDLGISKILTREFARDKEKERDFPAIVSLKLILTIATLGLIFIGSFFVTLDPEIRKIIWILALYTLINRFLETVYSFFRARQKMEHQAWAEILQAALLTGFGFFVLFTLASVQYLSLSYLLAAFISLTIILVFFHFKVFPLRFSFNKSIWKVYLAMSWPMALVGVFGAIYVNIDSTMMGYFGQITQAGWYNAAHKITGVAVLPMILISQSFFPALSRLVTESKGKLQSAWNYYMKVLIFLVVPLVVGGIALAPKIIDFVYGLNYSPSILAFQILLISSAIGALINPFIQALLVSNQQKKIFQIALFGAIINFVLNLILIPKYSLYGAAFSTVVTFLFMFILFFRFTVNFTQIKPLSSELFPFFAVIILSSILMYFIISQSLIHNLHIVSTASIGLLSYLICFFFLNFLSDYITKKRLYY